MDLSINLGLKVINIVFIFQVCGTINTTKGDTFSVNTPVNNNTYQAIGNLNCLEGFGLADGTGDNANTSVDIECSSNGQWNVTTIVCEKKGTI